MSVQHPAMTVIGTAGNNIWAGHGLSRKLAVVCHIMEGTLAGCDSWFSNPAAQASANYGIGKDGSIHQYVDPQSRDAPYANGLVNLPDPDAQAIMSIFPGTNVNWYTVSIEHEGNSGDVLTGAQLASSAALCAWLCQTFSIPPDEQHILGHYEIDSVTRAHCPGWDRAGWVRYVGAVTAALGTQPDPRDAQIATLKQAVAAITADRDTLKGKVAAAVAALA